MQLKRGQTFMLSGCGRIWVSIVVVGGRNPETIMCDWCDDGTLFWVGRPHKLTRDDVDALLSGSSWKLI